MKVKIADINEAKTPLESLLVKRASSELSLPVVRLIQNNVREIGYEIELLSDISAHLIKKYGEPVLDDNGNETGNYKVDRYDLEAMKKYREEYREYLETEVEIEITKIPMSLVSTLGLNIAEMASLSFMLDEES